MKTIQVSNTVPSVAYMNQAITFLEESSAKLSVAKTIFESQALINDTLLDELADIQNQIEDFHKQLNSNS